MCLILIDIQIYVFNFMLQDDLATTQTIADIQICCFFLKLAPHHSSASVDTVQERRERLVGDLALQADALY